MNGNSEADDDDLSDNDHDLSDNDHDDAYVANSNLSHLGKYATIMIVNCFKINVPVVDINHGEEMWSGSDDEIETLDLQAFDGMLVLVCLGK